MSEYPGLAGRDILLRTIDNLVAELARGPEEAWENTSLADYLEALGALLEAIENAYTNCDEPVPDDPWTMIARAFYGARFYE